MRPRSAIAGRLPSSGWRSRRGQGLVDWLLIMSVAALATIVAAYYYIPEFQRGLALVATELAARLGLD